MRAMGSCRESTSRASALLHSHYCETIAGRGQKGGNAGGGILRLSGQRADFIRHDGEALAFGACTRRLNGRVE